jgi:hypothetical protein
MNQHPTDQYKEYLNQCTIPELSQVYLLVFKSKATLRGNKRERVNDLASMLDSGRVWDAIAGNVQSEEIVNKEIKNKVELIKQVISKRKGKENE